VIVRAAYGAASIQAIEVIRRPPTSGSRSRPPTYSGSTASQPA